MSACPQVILRRTARLAGLTTGLVAGGVLLAGPALAHVTISPGEGHAGEYTVATMSVPHGCNGSATTKVAIQIPEEIPSVTPTRNPLWDVSKKMVKLADPIKDAHGNEITERVGEVVYTARTPLPDGYRDAFELSFQVPDTVGKTLRFPAIQTCEKDEAAWVEVAAEGQAEPAYPAPSFKVLAAAAGDTHGVADTSPTTDGVVDEASDGDGTEVWGILGALLGAGGLVLGGLAFGRTRRKA